MLRSSVLNAGENSANGDQVVFSPSAGTTALLKSAYVDAVAGSPAGTASLYVSRPSGGSGHLLPLGPITGGESFSWEGWVVLEPGDEVHLVANTADCAYWLSGALLQGVVEQ